jgi:hypothetical protein
MTSAEPDPEAMADVTAAEEAEVADAADNGDGVDNVGADVNADGSADATADAPASSADGVSAGQTSTQARLAQLAVGTAMIAGEQMRGGVRTVGGRTAAVAFGLFAKAKDQTERARGRLFEVMDDAERRGRDTLAARRQGATTLVSSSVDDAMAWAQVKVMPQLIDNLVPHLISDVVPRLIDGAMPEIRDRVVPVIIGDLTTDARVQELVVAQSRGLIGQLAEQLRTNSVRADDRLEAAAHRVVGREKGASAKGLNEIRGV